MEDMTEKVKDRGGARRVEYRDRDSALGFRIGAKGVKPLHNKPIAVLQYKIWVFIVPMLIILWSLWFFSLGLTGSYFDFGEFVGEIYQDYQNSLLIKILIPIFWLYSPTLIQIFRIGNVFFYDSHVELRPILPWLRIRSISYDVMHVKTRRSTYLLTTWHEKLWWKEPFAYWVAIYWNGIGAGISHIALKNTDCIPIVEKIIQEKALSIEKL